MVRAIVGTSYTFVTDEGDTNKKEKYVMDAFSPTEAEKAIVGWKPDNFKDFDVTSVTFDDYDDIVFVVDDPEDFFIITVRYLESVTKTGKKKYKTFKSLVGHENIEKALNYAKKNFLLESTDSEIRGVAATKMVVEKDLLRSFKDLESDKEES